MKNIVLVLCLLFTAFSEPVFAQTPPPAQLQQDTLIVKLRNRNQVFIIGRSLKQLADYQRADTLKTWFFADLERTLAANQFSETPKRIYYLVNQTGKRRLKAEISGESEPVFNLEMEKKRLIQDLPPFHYTIYDLPKNVELHFFLEDTTAFALAANTNLAAAIQELNKDKKKLTGLSVYRLEQGGLGFIKQTPKRNTRTGIEGLGYLGAMLLGNQLSPVISYDLFLTLNHTPATFVNNLRLGFSYTPFVLSSFEDGQFKNFNPGNYWHIILQSNAGLEKNTWFGISAGQVKTLNPIGIPESGFKWGLVVNHNRDCFSYDIIDLEKRSFFKSGRHKQLLLFTYRRSIL